LECKGEILTKFITLLKFEGEMRLDAGTS